MTRRFTTICLQRIGKDCMLQLRDTIKYITIKSALCVTTKYACNIVTTVIDYEQ